MELRSGASGSRSRLDMDMGLRWDARIVGMWRAMGRGSDEAGWMVRDGARGGTAGCGGLWWAVVRCDGMRWDAMGCDGMRWDCGTELELRIARQMITYLLLLHRAAEPPL